MVSKKVGFSKTKIWLVFGALFTCGAFVGVGIANWGHAVKNKLVQEPVVEQRDGGDMAQGDSDVSSAIRDLVEREKNKPAENENSETLTRCQAVEKVLLDRLHNDDYDCEFVKQDLDTLKKLVTYGCDENNDKYKREIDNKNAIFEVTCDGWTPDYKQIEVNTEPCEQIEANLQRRIGDNYVDMPADRRIDRAKLYAIMAEKGCPENSAKYVNAAKKELEIARGINDDEFDEHETIEVVETYKRLKMQQDAEEIFDKVKKMTNPAIDFIMQVEKIINE